MIKETALPGGDSLSIDEKAIVINLRGPRHVLGTSYLNGGYRTDLAYIFNYCEIYGRADERCEMRAPTNEGHLMLIAEELGLDPAVTTGLSTSAKMKYAVLRQAFYGDFSLTVMVTAGIDANGGRVGDPACWHEKAGLPVPEKPGTINIILSADANLAPGAMARALSLATEAKTAALQELLAPSCFSAGLATGSGTDGIIVVSNPGSSTFLTNAGQHTKLGEHIGSLVVATVKEALVAENGFEAYIKGNLLKRVKRFGITAESLWKFCLERGYYTNADHQVFKERFAQASCNEPLIARVTIYTHLLDLLNWRLLEPEDAMVIAMEQLKHLVPGWQFSFYPRPGEAAEYCCAEFTSLLEEALSIVISKGKHDLSPL